MERARVEALGARNMAGMRANLSASLALRMRSDPIARAQSHDDVPISTALELMLRETLTGETAPHGTATGLSLVRERIAQYTCLPLTPPSMLLDHPPPLPPTPQLPLRPLHLSYHSDPLRQAST